MAPTATCPVVAPDGNETPDDRPLANLRFEPVFAHGTRALRPTFPLETWAVAFAVSLGYWISRNPSDLLAHMQRIHLHHRLGQGEATYGAMLDLFVALRGGGAALRQRMLCQVANILNPAQRDALEKYHAHGTVPSDPETSSRSSRLPPPPGVSISVVHRKMSTANDTPESPPAATHAARASRQPSVGGI